MVKATIFFAVSALNLVGFRPAICDPATRRLSERQQATLRTGTAAWLACVGILEQSAMVLAPISGPNMENLTLYDIYSGFTHEKW